MRNRKGKKRTRALTLANKIEAHSQTHTHSLFFLDLASMLAALALARVIMGPDGAAAAEQAALYASRAARRALFSFLAKIKCNMQK